MEVLVLILNMSQITKLEDQRSFVVVGESKWSICLIDCHLFYSALCRLCFECPWEY